MEILSSPWLRSLLLALLSLGWLAPPLQSEVVMSEIMYHPISEDPRHEFIELHNRGPAAVNLAGWQFSSGVRFTFPSVSIPANGYLVVAADVAAFRAKYPGIQNVVGNWQGALSNSDEDIDLDDATGKREDTVHYASEGDWATRARGPLDQNHQGWIWVAPHDGGGKSLELINFNLSNNHGQNWAASIGDGGTPGRVNSVTATNSAPLILDVAHFPIIPRPADPVVVSARIKDEQTNNLIVTLHHRVDRTTAWTTNEMFDDGAHGDGLAGDGFFAAQLINRPVNTVVEFYVSAADAEGNSRTWPGPVEPTGTQLANLLYQVGPATPYAGTQPLYLLIMTESERAELDYIGDTLPDALSDALMNGTFISVDQAGTDLHYNAGFRNRGHGSRTSRPNNYHVEFPNDRRWKDVRAINLNSHYPHAQIVGSLLFQKAGVPAADATIVQARVNNTNLAVTASPQFGSYVALESLNSDFTDNHFPGDPSGNVYRGVAGDDPPSEADLYYRGPTAAPYRINYRKETNESEDQWADLIRLTQTFSESPTNTYASDLNRVVHVHEWLDYFAINALFDNNETGLYMGYGDDYGLYFGTNDPRALLVAHDHDTIMGQGDSPGTTTASIYRAAALSNLGRFLQGPEFELLYHAHLRGLITSLFSADQLHPLLEQQLMPWVPNATINQMKNFAAARNTYVLSQLPHLVPIDATWRYDQSGTNLGTSWREASFNDTAWSSGQGLFYNESATLPATKRTQLSLNGQTTYYLRTRFTLPSTIGPFLNAVALQLSAILDDGAVVYLNGWEIFRLGIPAGAVNSTTLADRAVGDAIAEGPFNIPGPMLVPGENVLAVEVHQTDPTSSDVVFGMILDLIVSPNTVTPSRVVLNEILAAGIGAAPDWVELFNTSSTDVDISNASLTDNSTIPQKWMFPEGTIVPGRGFITIRCDTTQPPSLTNTGFSLKPNGDDLYFFDSTNRSGALLDSLEFGLQAAGFTVGRIPDGAFNSWRLTTTTSNRANVAASVAGATTIKINEWLADPVEGDDWFELYNPNAHPVDLSGTYLSDDFNTQTESRLPALSFLGTGTNAYLKLIADSQLSKGPNHVDFKLSASGDSIVFFTSAGAIINSVTFGPQTLGVAQGRLPDGSTNIVSLPGNPTPGAGNASAPVLLAIRSNGQMWLRFTALAGQPYTLQVSDSLINTGAWTTLRTIAAQATNGPVESSDFILTGNRLRLYRLLQPQAP